jgi:HCO3- transporter family.
MCTFYNIFLLVCIADKTDNLIGISETLIATSAAGIFFALLAGQPLIIIGATGPLLLFDESLYSVSLNCHFFSFLHV